ncbi:hypothetical protein TELCIR_04105, partial [Teladorsagia circumcincta]
KELGRFLNTDEAIAMGALYQAAHLSKGFKVKPFGVEELVLFPVQVNFVSKQKQENGDFIEKPITRQVFQYKGKYPTTKKVSGEFDSLVSHLTTVSVFGVGKALEDKLKPEENEFLGVKVGFQMDLSGILRIEKAEAVVQRKSQGVVESITNTITGFFSKKTEEGEPTDSEDRKDEDGAESVTTEEKSEEKPPAAEEKPQEEASKKKTDEQSDDKEEQPEKKVNETTDNGENKTATEEKTTANTTAETEKKNATADKAAEEKKKPQVERVTLKTKEKYTTAHMMSKDDVARAKKLLEEFEKRERHARERAAAENELEGYAFEVSQLVEEDDYIKHSTEEERSKLLQESKRIRSWLEDEVTPNTETADFTKNHAILVALVRPIKKRIDEGKTLPPALANLESMLNSSRVMASMGGDDEKSLFNKSDADAFTKKLDRLTTWLEEKKSEQEKRQPHEDPTLMTSEVYAKLKSLDRELNSFMKKMKQTKLKDVEERMKHDSKKKDDKSEKEENVTTAEKTEQSTTAEKEGTAGTEGVKADSQATEQPLNTAGEAPAVEKEGVKETKAGEAKSQAAEDSDANVEKVEL